MTVAEGSGSELDSLTGWLIVALSLANLLVVWGFIFTFTVYADALAGAFGLSPIRASSVFSVTTAAFYVAGGALGVLVARLPLRRVVLATGIALGVAVGLVQVVSSYVGLLLAFGLIGAAGGTVFVVIISLVPQWFDRYEGRAMGIALTGNGIGVLVLPFVWLWLLERTDFRGAFALVGGVTVVLVLVSAAIFRRPGGVRSAETPLVDFAWLRTRLTDARFVVALVGYPLIWGWYFVLSSGLVDILTTSGIARAVAAGVFGTIGGVSVLARVASGAFADYVGPRKMLTAGVVLAGSGMFALLGVGGGPLLYATIVLFGVGLGAVAALFSPVLLRAYGVENATAVVGLFTISEAVTAFSVPIVTNYLVGLTGGYTAPLVLMGAVTILGAAMFHWGTDPSAASG